MMDGNFTQLLLGTGVTTAFHPIAYTKILIQLGYEPLAPVETTSIFGRKVLCYPSAFKYIGHIKKTDGFLGLYRGLGARLISGTIGSIVTSRAQAHFREGPAHKAPYSEIDGEEETIAIQFEHTCRVTCHETIARCCGVIASHPLHVVMVRTMAQFVGKETGYDNVFSGVLEVYRQDGILGFFAGIVPRLLGEVATIWLSNVLAFLVNTYLVPHAPQGGKDMKSYTTAVCSLLVTQITYPFNLVSNIMTVSKSGLSAGEPPVMPKYAGWVDCWSKLSAEKQLKRGSSLFWRQYKGPTITAAGVLRPTFIS